MKQYWINTGKKTIGPVTRRKLREYVEAGRLKPDHLISTDQLEWSLAKELRGLFRVDHKAPKGVSGDKSTSEDDPVVKELDLRVWSSDPKMRKQQQEYADRMDAKDWADRKREVLIVGIRTCLPPCLSCVEGDGRF